ncbi:MFS transporter [Liquorilactobacillus sicerae]|uniref:MFS transporter n=1 Tax=Liquorilactobacillus sicerae TaxID=1416943 RepID=UPI0024808259|nr:MFS transporter [Liquorilactobacillus sicerae]
MKFKYRRNIRCSYSYSLLAFLGITSLWVIYLQQQGLSLVEIGWCESIFHLTSFLFEVPSGLLADRFSYRANLFASRLMAILSAALLLLSHDFWLDVISFVISALSYNLQSGTLEALLYDSLKLDQQSKRYPRVISWTNVIIEFADASGIVLAGLFVHWHFGLVYVIEILVSSLALVSVGLLKEPSQRTTEDRAAQSVDLGLWQLLQLSWQTLRDLPLLRNLMIFQALFDSFCTTYYFYFQSLMDSQHFAGWLISTLLAISAMINMAVMKAAPWLQQKVSKRQLVLWLSLALTGLLLLNWLGKMTIYLLVFLLANGLTSLNEPIFSSYYNDLIDSTQRATLLSVANLLFSLVMIILFPLTGWLLEKLSFAVTFGLYGSCLLLILLAIFKSAVASKR